MTHHEILDALAGYALGSLSPQEAEQVSAHVNSCPDCARELSQLLEQTAFLAEGFAVVEPPAELRAQVMRRLPTRISSVVSLPQKAPPTRLSPWLGLAVAAVICLLLGQLWRVSTRLNDLSGQLEAAHVTVEGLRGQVTSLQAQVSSQEQVLARVESPKSRILTLKGPGQGEARLIYAPGSGSGTLLANLAPLPPNQVYELWLIAGKKPVGFGVFRAGPKTTSLLSVQAAFESYQVAAITVENGPSGAAAPTSKPLWLAKI
jgi:anti-sigma-K factor RskA